ncbi:MAG: TetR/AcrR family transcriptional regulator [Acidimicrobiales bacterium]
MATKKTPPKTRRRSPISRDEGERRLIEATIGLLAERSIGEVGVRDIAARADVNHGFVHTWFGGKNALLQRVVAHLLERVAGTVRSAPSGALAARPFDPDVQLVIRVVMWLALEGEEVMNLTDSAVISALAERYVEVEGLRPDDAHIAAQQAVAIAVATVMYGHVVGLKSNDDTMKVFTLWRHILGLLAQHPSP